MNYDAVLIASFGGPESPDQVMPFLENVLRGKNIPHERMLEVAEHYYHFGGKSPINDQNRQLIAALQAELALHGPALPIYWGNRNWGPFFADTLHQMKADGIRRALAFVTSAFSSYSGCRQYREDIIRARETAGEGAPVVDKIRAFYNHPGFVEAVVSQIESALATFTHSQQEAAQLIFTAHSIPISMSQTCDYEKQLLEACRLVAEKLGHTNWRLVYQSRSGPPSQPWLAPDILDCLREIKSTGGSSDIVIAPIGFVSDHMEVLFDLDTQAHELCIELGLNMVRAKTVGTHPRFITMVRELITERLQDNTERPTLGILGPRADFCPTDCCPAPTATRPPTADPSSPTTDGSSPVFKIEQPNTR